MKHPILRAATLAAVLPVLSSAPLALPAQDGELTFPQLSPGASIKQTVGLVDVEVEYSRPSMRGRKIFGGLVPYGEVWRTGANAATKLTFGADVKLDGHAVPAGSYALVTIPGETEWTVILSKVTGDWGAYAYDEKNDLLRLKVKPVALPAPMETMTIEIGDIGRGMAKLSIAWDRTRVPVTIDTDLVAMMKPQIEAAMAGEGEKPYFQAAMFYYEYDIDLGKAVAWIDEAAKARPDAVWIVYRQGLVRAKAGDKAGAMESAKQALELAGKAGGSLGAEYTRLSETLIASLK